MKRIFRIVIVGTLLTALATWPMALAATKTVKIPAKAFDPVSVTVTDGDTVRWIDQDSGRIHTVTATSASRQKGEDFTSSNSNCKNPILNDCLHDGDVYSHTFHTVGTFVYYCKVHGRDTSYPSCGMCGYVRVKAKIQGTSPPTGAPTSPGATGTGSGSPSASPTGTTTATGSASAPLAGGPVGDDSGGVPAVAIAAVAVVVLAGSGFVVYRTMIRR